MSDITLYLSILSLLCLQPATPTLPIDHLDDFIKDFMSCRETRTLSIAVVKDGQTLVAKGYGYQSNNRSATNQTMHLIASLTKAFTATLLGQLLKEKELTYDTPIRDILSDVRFPSDYVTKHVTVRDLLSHRTGVPRYDWIWLADAMNISQIAKRIRYMESSGFREKAIYNNNMYALAGRVAEALGGAPFEDLVTSRLLRPLGMNSTTFWKRGRHVKNFVQGEREFPEEEAGKSDPVLQGLTNIAPAIAMISSASDMARWMHFLLKPTRHLQEVVAETLTPSTIVLDDPNLWENQIKRPKADVPHIYDKYGLAWFLGTYRTYQTVMHYGSYVGSYSHITLMRDRGLAIFSSNSGGRQSTAYNFNSILHTHVLDLLLGHVPWMTSQRACDFAYNRADDDIYAIPEVDKTLTPERSLEDYVGVYYHSVFGFCHVTRGGGTNMLTYGRFQFEMFYSGEDSFNAVPSQKDWGSWFITAKFIFNKDSQKVVLPFEGSTEFTKIPKSANVAEWTRTEDLQTASKNNHDLCSSALTFNSRTERFFCIIITTLLGIIASSHTFTLN